MALVGNGVRMGGGPHNAYSNAGIQSVERGRWNRSRQSFYAGQATVVSGNSIADTAAFPNGYQPPYTWVMAPKGGGLSAYNTISGDGALTISSLSMGVALASSLDGNGTISAASLSLIVQLAGALVGSGDVSSATLQAISTLSAALSGSGSVSAAALSLIVSIQADLTASGSLTANLRGLLSMAADIVVTGDLLNTANVGAAVWNAVAAALNEPGTMGEKMNSAGGGSSPTDIANAVWEEPSADHEDPDTMGGEIAKQKLLKNTFAVSAS